MNYQFNNTLATDYASKPGDFKVERITTPRPSCAGMLTQRRALTSIIPGYKKRLAGLSVRRTTDWEHYTYTLNGHELALAEMIDILQGRVPVPLPKKPIQLEMDLGDDE